MASPSALDEIVRTMDGLETQKVGTEVTFNAAIGGEQATAFITANVQEHPTGKYKVYYVRSPLFSSDGYGDSVCTHYDLLLLNPLTGRGFLFGSQGVALGAKYKTPGIHNVKVTVLKALPIGCEYQGDIETRLTVFAVYIAMLVENREYDLLSFNCQTLAHTVLKNLFDADIPIQSYTEILRKFVSCKLLNLPRMATNLVAQVMRPSPAKRKADAVVTEERKTKRSKPAKHEASLVAQAMRPSPAKRKAEAVFTGEHKTNPSKPQESWPPEDPIDVG
jgi:hypothetical protein